MPNTATAQQIMDAANAELGLPLARYGAASVDQTGRQGAALLDSIGEDLCRVHDWQFLMATHTFNADGVASSFALPTDFKRIVNQTLWATDQNKPGIGPMSPQTWGWHVYGLIGASNLEYRYRILGDLLHILPLPPNGESFAFYYIIKNWVEDNIGTPKSAITAGTDVPLFDKRLMVSALKMRLWGQKGFDTTKVDQEFNFVLQSEKGVSQAAPVIGLSRNSSPYLISWGNVAEDSWVP